MKRQPRYQSEKDFIVNFFDHNDWTYEPRKFKLNGTTYTPDFYDIPRDTYIEVAASRQAFEANKHKYNEFVSAYPDINFEIRKHTGHLVQWTGNRVVWNPPKRTIIPDMGIPKDVFSVMENMALQKALARALKGSLTLESLDTFLDAHIPDNQVLEGGCDVREHEKIRYQGSNHEGIQGQQQKERREQ